MSVAAGALAALEAGPIEVHAPPAMPTGRVIAAGLIGNVMEWYDFAIYGYFAVAIGANFFPAVDPVSSTLAAFAVFAVGFLARPLGGVLFGHIGDRMGRKRALTASVVMMAVPTVRTRRSAPWLAWHWCCCGSSKVWPSAASSPPRSLMPSSTRTPDIAVGTAAGCGRAPYAASCLARPWAR
jgi:MFS family permease